MKHNIITIIITLLTVTTLAQQHNYAAAAKKTGQQESAVNDANAIPKFVAPVSVQVLTGSQGIGADVKYGYSPRLSGRLGFGIMPVDANHAFGFSSFRVMGQMSARFTNVHLLADYSPFKNSNIRLVGGAAYLIKGNADALITPSNGYTLGKRAVNKDDIGVINARVNWQGVAPYLGAALLKPFPNHLFNVNLDVGAYYISSPGTSFTGTKLLTDNQAAAKQFNSNMQGYCWLPVVQLNFNFRIK